MMSNNYDSYNDTMAHKARVGWWLSGIVFDINRRIPKHDNSKLESPEKEVFDVMTPRLKELEYGTQEYKDSLTELGDALTHHYANNRHHPEHFGENGIRGMTLVDLMEMLCDWKASSERTKNGDIMNSVLINQERFGYSDDLAQIMHNTIRECFGEPI